jgi:hypothetical protein
VNLWVVNYAAHRVGSSVLFQIVQGDDGVYTFQGNPSLLDLAGAVSELGMTISEKKSIMEPGVVHYLQDLHDTTYMVGGLARGVRPLEHVLNSAMSQERNDGKPWDRDCDTVRWLQQFGEAVYHPSSELFYDWLYQADWMCEGMIERLRVDGATERLSQILACVNRKDSNSFWGLTPSSFLNSPVIQYLLRRRSAS